MAKVTLELSADTTSLDRTLSALTDAAESFPDFRHALVGLLETGEELFTLECDRGIAPIADQLIVRFYPSDGLVGLVTAFRARNPDLRLLEHIVPPSIGYDDNAAVEAV